MGIPPPFFVGLQDSINPYALSVILIFVFFLSIIDHSRKSIMMAGFFFIISSFFTNVFLAFGLFDFMLRQEIVQRVFQYVHLGLAFCFIVVGALSLVDWSRSKKGMEAGNFIIKFPHFLKESQKDIKNDLKVQGKWVSLKNMIGMTFFSMMAGFLASMLGSIWPQDYFLYLGFYYLMIGGNAIKGFLTFLKYGLGFVMPLVLIWLTLLAFISTKLSDRWKKSVPLLKITTSAVFLSVGMGLIQLYIMRMYN